MEDGGRQSLICYGPGISRNCLTLGLQAGDRAYVLHLTHRAVS
jgi:hypothetical protein